MSGGTFTGDTVLFRRGGMLGVNSCAEIRE